MKEENGNLVGIWGAMSDFSRSFQPWGDSFSKGLYLAGVECRDDAEAPQGWTKWVIPGFEYAYVECDRETVFPEMIAYFQENNIPLAGAVHDFTCPQTGKDIVVGVAIYDLYYGERSFVLLLMDTKHCFQRFSTMPTAACTMKTVLELLSTMRISGCRSF